MLRYFILSVALLLAACDQEAEFQKWIPKAEAEEGKQILAQLAARRFDLLEERLDPILREPDAQRKLGELAALIPAGQPKNIAVIGSNTIKRDTDIDYNLTYEYEYDSGWVIEYAFLQRKAGKLLLSGLQIIPQAQSQKAINTFSFAGKGPLHYIIFAFACLIPILIVATLVLCARAKRLQKKWLWMLFIAVGLVQFSLNWTTGQLNIQPFSFQLLGAGFFSSGPYAPLVLTIALPIGALVFLARRHALQPPSDA